MPTTYTTASDWVPPGRNCGACGHPTCESFSAAMAEGKVGPESCPFYRRSSSPVSSDEVPFNYSGMDVVGQSYDFVIRALPGEPSARKIVLPFRPDMVERMDIRKGDIVTGRPAGAGCPVQHVIRVLDCDWITGVITGHVVGPAYSRGRDVKDVREYHMLGFEGEAVPVLAEPRFGVRHSFLPGFCMMDRAHTGLVNMVIKKPWGLHVRVEDVVIL